MTKFSKGIIKNIIGAKTTATKTHLHSLATLFNKRQKIKTKTIGEHEVHLNFFFVLGLPKFKHFSLKLTP